MAFCGSHERRLLNDLNLNYNKLERPVAEESDALEIKFGLTLQQILDVVSLSLTPFIEGTHFKNIFFSGRKESNHHNQPVAQLGELNGFIHILIQAKRWMKMTNLVWKRPWTGQENLSRPLMLCFVQ